MSELRSAFRAMGTEIRLAVDFGPDGAPGAGERALASSRRFVESFDRRLSRFRADSELRALNEDGRTEVPASAPLRALVRAALDAARRTDGLVDPTLVRDLANAGYADSREGRAAESLARALTAAPLRRAARRHGDRRWEGIAVDDGRGVVFRPPGLAIDSGGVGKGLAADLLAARLGRCERFAVDCGGDVRVGGPGAAHTPYEIAVEHPFGGEPSHLLRLASGAVATSGIGARLWRTPDGGFAHHLLDPSTGRSAWTGVVSATALAPTAVEAEWRAKAALLGGAPTAERALGAAGGLIVGDDGEVRLFGPLRPRPVVRLRRGSDGGYRVAA